jgi:hypothetical protein
VGGSISQVRPKDKMAMGLQNGDIIVLSVMVNLYCQPHWIERYLEIGKAHF